MMILSLLMKKIMSERFKLDAEEAMHSVMFSVLLFICIS